MEKLKAGSASGLSKACRRWSLWMQRLLKRGSDCGGYSSTPGFAPEWCWMRVESAQGGPQYKQWWQWDCVIRRGNVFVWWHSSAKPRGSPNVGWEGSVCSHFHKHARTVFGGIPQLNTKVHPPLGEKVVHAAGDGDSSVVRAPDSWLKGPGFKSLQERREKFLLQGQLSVLTLMSVSVPPLCYCSST